MDQSVEVVEEHSYQLFPRRRRRYYWGELFHSAPFSCWLLINEMSVKRIMKRTKN